MSHRTLHLLEFEYVQGVLNAALSRLPDNVLEDLVAAGIGPELDTGMDEGETALGRFDSASKQMQFFGPAVLDCTVGQLPARVAEIAADAWGWSQKDPWRHLNRRGAARKLAREWGFDEPNDEEAQSKGPAADEAKG